MPEWSEEILSEARGARETSERLLPLLELLNDPEGEGRPIDELKALLTAIVEILGHHTRVLQRLESASVISSPLAH
ncbi:hypothetical protein [Rhodopseudomonas palustris]|uniref:hypothetical protein n=1 Tax=Rhodopseudomonas palustris TaxID=1076 RepID=UPI001F3CE14E|nr:hypothetical protein [Rhodopseudomonas palustris]